MDKLPAELASLIDLDPIRAAESEIAEAQRRYQAAEDGVRAADRDLREARDALPRLLDAAVAGTAVSSATLARVHRRIEDATKFLDFQREVSRRLQPDPREGEGRLARAKAQAFAPLFEHAVGLRIAAGKRADEAASTPYRQGDPAEYEAAHQEWKAATAIMNVALRAGARHPNATYRDNWPTTEHAERGLWGREINEKAAA